MTRRDEHLWDEEVVEIFLDPDRSGRDYYELEVNPANVVCDLRMVSPWPDKKGDIDWNLAGLETRVHARGSDGGAPGWTVTAFLPWRGLRALPSAGKVALPPKPGDAWRFNVFRIERPGGQGEPGEGRRVRRLVAPVGAELPRRRGLPRPRVRGCFAVEERS